MVWIGGKVTWADPSDTSVFNAGNISRIAIFQTAAVRKKYYSNIGHRSDREVA